MKEIAWRLQGYSGVKIISNKSIDYTYFVVSYLAKLVAVANGMLFAVREMGYQQVIWFHLSLEH
ncbi:MAG TPA: hypothetical protein VGJ90_10215 [Methylophilaceae bacterium]|jgi:hypothetical protein